MGTVFSRTPTYRTIEDSLVGQIIHVLVTLGMEEGYFLCVKYPEINPVINYISQKAKYTNYYAKST